jgi:two-component system KDP operon response regulator KdpE
MVFEARSARRTRPARHVLLVIDAPTMRYALDRLLTREGYVTLPACAPSQALERLHADPIDLMIVDLSLEGQGGPRLCAHVRNRHDLPILAVGAREERDTIRALNAGADVCLGLAIRPAEFLAYVRALERRCPAGTTANDCLVVGHLRIDPAGRQVSYKGARLRLSPTEFDILLALARHASAVVSHQQLLRQVWGEGCSYKVDYLWTYIRRLRTKVEEDPANPRLIESVSGVGYRLIDPLADDASISLNELVQAG